MLGLESRGSKAKDGASRLRLLMVAIPTKAEPARLSRGTGVLIEKLKYEGDVLGGLRVW